eukprot:scaffold13969_cov125-Isochrysis_galbana.AAC.9
MVRGPPAQTAERDTAGSVGAAWACGRSTRSCLSGGSASCAAWHAVLGTIALALDATNCQYR